MAFIKGTAVDPRLGALDFSGFTRAAEIQASALADLGDKVGKGMQQYSLNKQELGQNVAKIEAYTQEDSNILADFETKTADELPTGVFKAYQDFKKGDTTLPNSRILLSHIENRMEAQQRQLEQQKNAMVMAEMERQVNTQDNINRIGGIVFDFIDQGQQEAKQRGEEYKMNPESLIPRVQAQALSEKIPLNDVIQASELLTTNALSNIKLRAEEADAQVKEAEAFNAEERIKLENEALKSEATYKDLSGRALIAKQIEESKGKGFEKVDEEIQKSMAKYITGGRDQVDRNINSLENILIEIQGDPDAGFRKVVNFLDGIPFDEAIQAAFNLQMTDIRDRIRGVAYQTLRETLGAQFTEREGQRLVETYFNPKLTVNQNIQRLNDFVVSLKQVRASQEEVYEYYRNNNTIEGFVPSTGRGSLAVTDLMNRYMLGDKKGLSSTRRGANSSGNITFTAIEDTNEI